jgi:CHAT domain-containing protein
VGDQPAHMDNELFLQHLRELPLEEGKAYIQEHIGELADHAAIGELLANEARHHLYTPFVSLKLAELLTFFGEYIHHMPSHALGLKAKGDALMVIRHLQAAIECLDAAGEEFLRLGDEGNWARSRISWIISAAWLGRVEEALQQAARARDVFVRLGEYYWVCVIDSNIALIYYYIGRYQDAIKLYEGNLSIYPTLANQSETFIKRSMAIAEGNQASALALLGRFEQAYHLHQKAQASLIALGETDRIINTEGELADIDYIQGYYGSALRRYYQARDSLIQNSVDDPILLAEFKLRIANCLVKLNRAQEACLLANEAVETYRQCALSFSAGDALREYATMLVAAGRLREALTALNEGLMIFDRGGFDPHAYATKLQQAELLLEMGSITAAYDQAHLVREYFEAKGLVARSVHASLVMASALIENAQQAEVYQREGQQTHLLDEALLLCKQTALQARRHNLQETVYKSHYLLGQIFTLQENPTKAARHFGAAIAQIERILDDLVYDLSPSFLHTTWAVYGDMIALCLQQSQVERAFSYLEQARSMALRQHLNKSRSSRSDRGEQEDTASLSILQTSSAVILRTQHELRDEQEKHRHYSVLLADIDPSVSPTVNRELIQQEQKRCEAKLSELSERLHLYQSNTHLTSHKKRQELRKVKQVDITQLSKSLSPNQLLLAYFLHKRRLVIFTMTSERLVTHIVPEGIPHLERLLPLLHAHLHPGSWPNPQQPPQQTIRRLLNKLYNLLVAPVAELLPASGYLTIVPYGPLHNLPFHALYDGSHFLIENNQVNYLPASSILMHFGTRRNKQNSRSTDIKMPTKPPLVFGYSGNGYLQRVLEEAKSIATLLNGRCYLEGEATIARLIEEASNCPIIHLATHGKSRLDAPNFSYVRLADGQLNAIDAFSMNLEGCELVTLSGCETGLALSGGGDEQLGLGRAFLGAGASSLVMSLWPVEDNATNELMQYFYQQLLKGESRVQALRAAQCSLLHQNESVYTHPYFWAAFRLVGEVGPLKHQRA